MKLFFEVLACNSSGDVNKASVAFSQVCAVSEFTPDAMTERLPDVKCIMLCGDVNYFIVGEDRATLVARIEAEYKKGFEYITTVPEENMLRSGGI